MTKMPMRCENCHQIVWEEAAEWDAKQITPAGWICSECAGIPRIFTLAELEREERP